MLAWIFFVPRRILHKYRVSVRRPAIDVSAVHLVFGAVWAGLIVWWGVERNARYALAPASAHADGALTRGPHTRTTQLRVGAPGPDGHGAHGGGPAVGRALQRSGTSGPACILFFSLWRQLKSGGGGPRLSGPSPWQVASVLLLLAFCYDIVFVFGTDIMETVALGSATGEQVPLLLRMPHFIGEVRPRVSAPTSPIARV